MVDMYKICASIDFVLARCYDRMLCRRHTHVLMHFEVCVCVCVCLCACVCCLYVLWLVVCDVVGGVCYYMMLLCDESAMCRMCLVGLANTSSRRHFKRRLVGSDTTDNGGTS